MIYKRKCKITFICHGATINTEANRLHDDENYPAINSTGRAEIEKIAQWVKEKGLKIDKIYACSALRTAQSARILSQYCAKEFETINTLKSKKTGVWSGLSYEEIEQKYPEALKEYHMNSDTFKPEGGESNLEFNQRINAEISTTIENNLNKRLIIVTHKDVIQSLIANALEIPIKNQFKVHIPTGSATQISYFEDFASLVYSAYIPL